MNVVAAAANILWIGASLAERQRFRAALRDPLAAQHSRLASCLERNRGTAIGRRFAGIGASCLERMGWTIAPELAQPRRSVRRRLHCQVH